MTGHRGAIIFASICVIVEQALHRGEGATMPGHVLYGKADSDPPPRPTARK